MPANREPCGGFTTRAYSVAVCETVTCTVSVTHTCHVCSVCPMYMTLMCTVFTAGNLWALLITVSFNYSVWLLNSPREEEKRGIKCW